MTKNSWEREEEGPTGGEPGLQRARESELVTKNDRERDVRGTCDCEPGLQRARHKEVSDVAMETLTQSKTFSDSFFVFVFFLPCACDPFAKVSEVRKNL